MNKRILGLSLIAGGILPCLMPSVIAAQPDFVEAAVTSVPVATETGAAEPQQRAPSSSRMMEEIVVTAQKREENLQDVPISVVAFSADLLDAKGISDPKDLPLATPGLTINQSAGFSLTYLRGVGSDGFLLADPSVALYIDGIYFPFSHGAAQNFGAIERVEVLKGPQGTLFGRNAVGGAINITTKAPSFSAPEMSVQTAYSSYDKLETRAHVNVPLSDTFAFSVSAQYNIEDNYREGFAGGEPLPKETSRGARLKLRWAPVESLDFTLAGFRLFQEGVTSMFSTNSDPSVVGRIAGIQPQRGYDGINDAPDYFDLDNQVVYGQASAFTSAFDIKLIGSHQNIVTAALYDFDGSPQPVATFSVPRQFANVDSAELQFLSNQDSWGADWLNWIGGVYYFKGKQGLDPARFAVAGSALDTLGSLAGPASPLGPLLGRLVTFPNSQDGVLDASGRLGTDSQSLFGQATATLTDWASLTLGLRYQEEKRTVLKSQGALILPVGDPLIYLSSPRLSDTTRTLKPKVSLDFRPWDDGLIYLSYQQATKSSTYNVINFLPVNFDNNLRPDLVKPENLTAYEIGLKTSLFDGTTRLSTAAFYYDMKNTQVQFISLLAGGAVTFENAPAARIFGFDFDVTSQILPDLDDGLVLTLGGAYLDSRFTDFREGQGFNEQTGIYQDNLDLTGGRLPRAPQFSGTVGLSQTIDTESGVIEAGGEYYYNTGYFYLAQNNPEFEQKSFGVLGARISYLYRPWDLRVTLFGKNLLDKFYSYGVLPTDFGPLDSPAPPRTVGIRLNLEF